MVSHDQRTSVLALLWWIALGLPASPPSPFPTHKGHVNALLAQQCGILELLGLAPHDCWLPTMIQLWLQQRATNDHSSLKPPSHQHILMPSTWRMPLEAALLNVMLPCTFPYLPSPQAVPSAPHTGCVQHGRKPAAVHQGGRICCAQGRTQQRPVNSRGGWIKG